ncbi:MAG: hypothetical protein ACK4N5_27660, partial [Myxococcales bacterium]
MSVIYDNNVSATIHVMMDRLTGPRPFGESWTRKSIRMAEVPAEYRATVKAAVGDVDSFDSIKLERRLFDTCGRIMAEDKGFLGLLPGNRKIELKEENRAARRDPLVKPLMDQIRANHARS